MMIVTKLQRIYEIYITKRWEHYKKMERKYHNINDMYWCVLKSKKNFQVPILKRLKMYKNGFNSDEYIKYDLSKNKISDYISEKARWDSRNINGEYNIVLDDKELFYYLFKDFVRTPQIIGKVKDETVVNEDNKVIPSNEIFNLLEKNNGLVFRVNKNGGGKGLYLLKYNKDKKNFELNGEKISKKDIINFIKNSNGYIITEAIKNARYSEKIFDKSVNTLRIVVAKKKDTEKYEVVATYHRFGCNKSIPGDNVCRGGLIAPINITTGTLGKATSSISEGFYDKHPDTNSQIEGIKVPNFDYIKDELVRISYKFSFLNFIAWDVVVTDDGFQIIEGNASSDIYMFQYFGGLKNETLGDIYKSYGII